VFNARTRQTCICPRAPAGTTSRPALSKGGQNIKAAAPRERMPLFVRAGSDRADRRSDQHVGEQPDGPIVLHVFTGADGAFSLYEDDGVSPGYKQGKFARVPCVGRGHGHADDRRARGRL
jgi:alpha-D-xyloside xylohydrolase